VHLAYPPAAVKNGGELFQQNCAFCHGKDAGGGETGPDLTRSKLVTQDVDGDKIGSVLCQGRPDKGMPHFDFAAHQIDELAAFIHNQQTEALEQTGGRTKVVVTLASGQTVTGTLAYLDEFTVGLIDPEGFYQSWRTGDVKFRVDAPADAHVELFDKYTNDDIHNLMAYLQTLR
jgi:cytochrome c oxidase cbb3-type subunit III